MAEEYKSDDEMDLVDIPPRKIAPWVEKYRPEKVDDVSHQEEVIKALKKSIELGSVPHLLFHGPPGTGKTTTILALARALYGPELYRSRILELNASDERGIKVVREKIKIFAQASVGTQKTPGYPCPRFKLIILDEADTMTPEAQSALRRIIENYAKVTRFCLLCNYVTRVIEPLASRCAKFRFKPLPVSAMTARIQSICQMEQVVMANEQTTRCLLETAMGDMRKAVTYLQSAHQLSLASTGSGGKVITEAMVYDISGRLPTTILARLWSAMLSTSCSSMVIQEEVHSLILAGYPVYNILMQLQADLLPQPDTATSEAASKSSLPSTLLSDLDKALISEKLAETELKILEGAQEELQLWDVACFMQRRCHAAMLAMPSIDNRSMSNH